MPSWRCRYEQCPGLHAVAAEACPGQWFCARTVPACPGHDPGLPPCASGDAFDCGARFCHRRHRSAGDSCPNGPWYCGQTSPLCQGHAGSGPEHRHGTGAIRLYGSMMRERRAATPLSQSVVRILRDADVAQIHFQLLGTNVIGRAFSDIACLVESGAITIRPLGLGAMDGTLGDYRLSVNVMEIILQNWTVAEKANIVHEAVHAMTDHGSPGSMDAVDHEAAAFVAGAWYYRMKTGGSAAGARAEAADHVVTALQRRRTPADEDVRALLEEVRRNYSGSYTFDGVAGAVVCSRRTRRAGRRR